MPLLHIAVIDICFILDVDVALICALIFAVLWILDFIEKRFYLRETRHLVSGPEYISRLACLKLLLPVPCSTQFKNFRSVCVNNYDNSSTPVPVLA